MPRLRARQVRAAGVPTRIASKCTAEMPTRATQGRAGHGQQRTRSGGRHQPTRHSRRALLQVTRHRVDVVSSARSASNGGVSKAPPQLASSPRLPDVVSNAPWSDPPDISAKRWPPRCTDAGKRIRRMLGRANGAAIELDPDDEVTLGLGYGEGIRDLPLPGNSATRLVWALGQLVRLRRSPRSPSKRSRCLPRTMMRATARRSLVMKMPGARPGSVNRRAANMNDIIKRGGLPVRRSNMEPPAAAVLRVTRRRPQAQDERRARSS